MDGSGGDGRAGGKLDAALDHFGGDVAGLVALDAGLSTGGFTDCLLQRGAARVIGIDVGSGLVRRPPPSCSISRRTAQRAGCTTGDADEGQCSNPGVDCTVMMRVTKETKSGAMRTANSLYFLSLRAFSQEV